MRKPLSDETRRRMSEAAKNRSPEAEARRIAACRSDSCRQKHSESGKGRKPTASLATLQKMWAANRKEHLTYSGIHAWIKRNWGPANCCELCGKENLTGQQAHWASKSHDYTRNRSDWLMLCRPCHASHDKKYNGTIFGNRRAGNTHCPHGHEYTPENTKTYNGCRKCLACNRIRSLEYYYKVKRT